MCDNSDSMAKITGLLESKSWETNIQGLELLRKELKSSENSELKNGVWCNLGIWATNRDASCQVELCDLLAKFVDVVDETNVIGLLNVFISLASTDTPEIRSAGVSKIVDVSLRFMEKEGFVDSLGNFCNEKCNSDLSYARITCAFLFEALYVKSPSKIKTIISTNFMKLLKDPVVQVRRNALLNLNNVVEHFDKETKQLLLKQIEVLIDDPQVSISLLTVNTLVNMLKGNKKDNMTYYPLFMKFAENPFWRVKLNFVIHIIEICEYFEMPELQEIGKIYNAFLLDDEPEIKIKAIEQMDKIIKMFDQKFILETFPPIIDIIINDPDVNVRTALATQITVLASSFGEKFSKSYYPKISKIICEDVNEVKMAFLSQIQELIKVIGIDIISDELLMTMKILSSHSNWRKRVDVIKTFERIASDITNESSRSYLLEMIIGWIHDSVFSIREATLQLLCKLSSFYGMDWTKQSLFPIIVDLSKNSNYLLRITCLSFIQKIFKSSDDEFFNSMMEIIQKLSKDQVANVRIEVVKTLNILLAECGKEMKEKIKHQLKEMAQNKKETDRDVKYFLKEILCE